MVTSQQAIKKYGDPNLISTQNQNMELWFVPQDIRTALSHVRFSALGTIGFPKKIYLNKDMRAPLECALRNLIERCLEHELKSWDGVFYVRPKRGLKSYSLHSWGIAFDINAQENGLGKEPVLSKAFVDAIKDAGFDWGGDWTRKDGMHFQLSSI